MLLVIYFKIMTHILEDFFMLLDFSAVHLTLYFHNCCKETLRISTVTFKDTQSNSWLLFILLIFISCFILKQNATMPRSYTPWKQLYADLQYTYDDTIFLDLLLYLCVILVQKLINQLENPLKKKRQTLLLSLCSGISFLTVLGSVWNGQSQVTFIYHQKLAVYFNLDTSMSTLACFMWGFQHDSISVMV